VLTLPTAPHRAQVSIRLTLDLMHPLRSLSTAASCVTRAAAATLVIGTPARRPPVVPLTPVVVDAAALAAATVDSPAQPRSRTSSLSPSAAPASAAKAHARISEIEDRCAFDELILNQQRCLHGELSARVAQLEAKHREDALERQARLAQLERENELDKRLLAVELITAASPVAPSPSRGVALLRRAAAPPPRAPPNTPGTLARALSNATLAGLPAEAPDDLALFRLPLLTSPGASSASSSASASPSSGSSLFYSAPDVMLEEEEEENTPPPDGTPTPARPMPGLRLARSGSVTSDRSGASCDSGASPAWGVMRQIPSFGGSQQATPRSVRRATPRRTTSASPATLAAAAQECTPASERPRRTSPTCGCRSPDSPADSPTIHAETCAAQASSASRGKPPLPLRRAFSTPPVAALAQLSPA
jgi:hypothetical protein